VNPRRLAALALLTVGPTAAACNYTGIAHAQTIPDCGGEGIRHTIPEGGVARCQGARILQDGQRWTVIVEVRDTGEFGARFTRPLPATADIFVELEAHLGGSGSGEAGVLVGFLPAGQTQVTIAGAFDPAVLMDFDCVTQTDAKAINGNLDKPLPPNQNRVRVAGGWFQFENCAPPPTTVPTTAPTSSPTTSPTSPPASSGSTTAAPTATSVVGGTIPATGLSGAWIIVAGLALIIAGFAALVHADKRAER
jgi:hypothetical protein